MNVIQDYPLSKVTTLGIGGPAKQFISVNSEDKLREAIKYAKENDLPFLVIGGGSNLLIADEGVEKLVIQNKISGISQNGNILTVKSGTPLQTIVNLSIEKGLSGINKLTGIPGTVGGAIYGNAGAYGGGVSENLIDVTCINPQTGKNIILKKEDCGFSYRDSNFKRNGLVVLAATFKLTPDDSQELKKESEEIKLKRDEKYPPGIKCPGSFYKNLIASDLPEDILKKIPPEKIVYGKIPAGALLEMVGAKGDHKGSIEIAPYHANLFVNKGDGNAKDFYTLAKKYFDKIKERFGISLEPEVQLINLTKLN